MAMDSKQYVSSDKKVKAAKAALADIKSRIKILEGQGDLPGVKDKLNELKSDQVTAQNNYDSAVSAAQDYFAKNKDKIAAQEEQAAATKEQQRLATQSSQEAALASVASTDPRVPKSVRQTIEAQREKPTFQPVTSDGGKFNDKSSTSNDQQVEDFAYTLKNARAELKKKTGPERKALAEQLNLAGFPAPITETYTDQLLAQYQSAISGAQAAWNTNKEFSTLATWLSDRQQQQAAIKAAGGAGGAGGAGTPFGTQTIYTPTKAESFLTDQFVSLFKREPTADEIKTWSAKLNKAQNDAAAVAKTTYKMINGVKTAVSTTGLDEAQWFKDQILKDKALAEEYKTAKTQATDINTVLKDKKIYDDAIAAAKGDTAKIAKINETTSYGRKLNEVAKDIEATVAKSGASTVGTPQEIAKYLIDRGLDLTSNAGTAYLNSQLSYGKKKVSTTDTAGATKTTDTYTGTAGSNVEALNKVALANGLTLDSVFDSAALPAVLADLNKGENINTYAKIIRDAAKVAWNVSDNVAKLMDQGVSLDSIYSTYKNTYANTLELDPSKVTLNDLAKTGVIGAGPNATNAPQNLYDFSRALRKDDRWQYTSQAHQEVADATRKILQDFGFMG